MKLRRIRLKNFRQFYGDQTIEIAPPGPKNVTLVHAENGVGKTTLLNAVLWTLFGDTTARFEQRESILNFEAEAEGARVASVDLTFEHEGADYAAMRTQTRSPGGQNRVSFQVSRFLKGSLGPELPNPESFVTTVIPRAMADYFFFDGEQAETFSAERNHKAVAEAIRNILGCTLLETAMDDLKYIARKFNEELGNVRGEDEIREKEAQIASLEKRQDEGEERIRSLEKDIDSFDTQLADINAKLRGAEAAKEIQLARESLIHQKAENDSQVLEAQTDILRWIGSQSLSVVSTRLTDTTLDFIDEESLRGRIPSPYNEEFVQGILDAEVCICGRELNPGTAEWRCVHELLRDAANAEVMGRVVRARARIAALKEGRGNAIHALEREQRTVARLLDAGRRFDQEIEELTQKLEKIPVTEIQERETARKELERRKDASKTERIRLQRDLELLQADILRLNEEVEVLARKNQHAQRLVLRRTVTQKAADVLKAILESYEKKARLEIQSEVNKILEKAARRHYQLEIDETFQLKLLFADGRPTPKSGGENQLMSLAFIAALVRFAEKRAQEEDSGLLIPATVAPLVLDSPFGQLDDSYRATTASFVPEMAPQVVLLVSSSQGKQEVMDALIDRIGAEYVLIAENRGPKGDKNQDYISVGGQKRATTLFNRERNLTKIERVI